MANGITVGTREQRAVSEPQAGRGTFGENQIRQEQAISSEIFEQANEFRKKQERTQVRNALNEANRAVLDLTNEEYGRGAADSIGAVQRTNTALTDIRKTASKNLRSRDAQTLFNLNFDSIQKSTLKNMSGFEIQQTSEYEKETLKSQIVLDEDTAIANRNNSEFIDEQAKKVLANESALFNERWGASADPALRKKSAQDVMDRFYGKIVKAKEQDSSVSAYAYFTQNKDKFSAEEQARLDNSLRTGAESEIVDFKAIEITNATDDPQEFQKMIDSATYTDSEGKEVPLTAEMKKATRSEVQKRWSDKKTFKAAAEVNYMESEGEALSKMSQQELAGYKVDASAVSISNEKGLYALRDMYMTKDANTTVGKKVLGTDPFSFGRFLNLPNDAKMKFDPYLEKNVKELGSQGVEAVIKEKNKLRSDDTKAEEDTMDAATKDYMSNWGEFVIDNDDDSEDEIIEKANNRAQFMQEFKRLWEGTPEDLKTRVKATEIASDLMMGKSGKRRYQLPYIEGGEKILAKKLPENVSLPRGGRFEYDATANTYTVFSADETVAIDYDSAGGIIGQYVKEPLFDAFPESKGKELPVEQEGENIKVGKKYTQVFDDDGSLLEVRLTKQEGETDAE